jgi:formate C-acetyltransferase
MPIPNHEPHPSERVSRLRERIVNAPREACVERARYLTQSMSAGWELHPLTRMSAALAHILENISVIIRPDELIVGCRTSKLKGAPFFPENKSRWIEGDVGSFEDRVIQKLRIGEDEARELREEILPFWRGRTVEERFEELLPADVAEDMDKYVFTMILEITYGIGHFTMNHARILEQGLAGVIAEARHRLESIPTGERNGGGGLFYQAVIRSLEAAVRFANRYADEAEAMAARESDAQRAVELEEIARACRRVPEHPARSFREAVQCVYFIHLIAQIESGGNSVSLGRIDQILAPYFEADLRVGGCTPIQARELLSLLFLKTNEIWNILEEAFIPGGEGTEGKTTQNVTVGGMSRDGTDATCALSIIGLDAFADICTVQPNFGVRLSPDRPEEFLLRAIQYARGGVPLSLFNDEVIVASLVDGGHALEDARDYGVVGCLEPNAQGKTFGSTFAVQINGIKCVEFALSNGVDNVFGYQSGIQSGDPADFGSFDQVWHAYCAQLSHCMGQVEKGMAALDQAIAELVPSPFASAMIDGPMEEGLDLTRGGAVYNSTGVQLIGFSNVADSLAAIQKAVFEEKRLSLEKLAKCLAEDWEDSEEIRSHLLHRIPKYGNDDDEVDAMAARVLAHFCDEVLKHESWRGGRFWPGVFSVGFHVAMGAFAGASPDGRSAGEVLGNGITPSSGRAQKGVTALLNSVTGLPLGRAHNGTILNLRFNPAWLRPEALASLMKTYLELGGAQVQFNMIDTALLREAQRNPDAHRDLVVRVSGYSALFTQLSELAQEEIISRMEYRA